MTTSTWSITGMTCDHCARAVTEEVTKLDGVTDVAVDVPAGRVTVTSSAPLSADAVRDAVDEAGYDLVDA